MLQLPGSYKTQRFSPKFCMHQRFYESKKERKKPVQWCESVLQGTIKPLYATLAKLFMRMIFFFTMKFLKIPDHAGNTGCQWFIISRKMENTLILYMWHFGQACLDTNV